MAADLLNLVVGKRGYYMDKDKIYNLIDADEELTDSEKREEYAAACENEEWEERERNQD